MRLARYTVQGQEHWGLILENQAHALDAVWPSMTQGIAAGWAAMAEAAREVAPVSTEALTWLPPVQPQSKILCVGLNYGKHVKETGRDQAAHPSLFLRHIDSFVGHQDAIVKPACSEQFDFEGELCVVIGREGRHIAAADAMSHVAGYTCMAENSVRDFQKHTAQVTAGKNFDRSGALGPWITAAGAIAEVSALRLTTRLNGNVVQDASLSELIFPIPELIAYISTFCVLRPGDIIATGTPEGIGSRRTPPLFMKAGDRLEVEVSDVATLSTRVIDETV